MELNGGEMTHFLSATNTDPAMRGSSTARFKGEGGEEGAVVCGSVEVVDLLAGSIVERGGCRGDVMPELPVGYRDLDGIEAFVRVGEVVCFRVARLGEILIRFEGEDLFMRWRYSYGIGFGSMAMLCRRRGRVSKVEGE